MPLLTGMFVVVVPMSPEYSATATGPVFFKKDLIWSTLVPPDVVYEASTRHARFSQPLGGVLPLDAYSDWTTMPGLWANFHT